MDPTGNRLDGAETSASFVTDILCGDSLDITKVTALHTQLSEALAFCTPGGAASELGCQHIAFKAGELARVDGAALQLLAAFFREAKGRGLRLCWDAPSEALIRAARLLGLADELGLGLADGSQRVALSADTIGEQEGKENGEDTGGR